MFTNPTVDDFKSYFVRDFPYGIDPDNNVLDADISRALTEVECSINQDLFCSQEEYTVGYLNLAAHMLVMNIQASSQGLNSQFEFLITSKSVGSISLSQQLPQAIIDNPVFAWYFKTHYGAKYVMMIYPRLAGNMFISYGATTP